jgi:hypothetical protein
MRVALWIDALERGFSFEDGMRYAQKFIFDYRHGLGSFEREYLRRVFPFFTFTRFNVPLQLEMMFKRPGVLSTIGKTKNLFTDSDDADLEQFLPPSMQGLLRTSYKVTNGQLQFRSGRNIIAQEEIGFLGDIHFWRGSTAGTVDIAMKEILGRLNPMMRVPIEITLGRNFYFGKEWEDDVSVRNQIFDIPGVRKWLQARPVKVGDRVFWRVNGDRWAAFSSSHLGRIYKTFAAAFDDSQSALDRSLFVFTGLRLNAVELGRQKDFLMNRAKQNEAALRRAFREGDDVAAVRLTRGMDRGEEERESLREGFQQLQELTGNPQ